MNLTGVDASKSAATHWPPSSIHMTDLQRYGLAVVSAGVALAISLLLQHFHFRDATVPLLLFAVAASAWYGGRGPAVLAAALSIISFYWFFAEPVRTPYIYYSQIPFFIIFVGLTALLSWFGTVRRRVEADLRQSHEMLREQSSLLGLTDKKANSRLPVESQGRFPALRLALIYAFFGSLWILLSDRLSFYLVPDLEQIERMQTYKGWFFIAVTSVLLWSLAKRFLSQVGAAEETSHRLNRKLQAISDCNQALLRATDEQSLLHQICRIVCEQAGYRMAFVAYAEHDEAKSVRPVAWTGAEEGYLASASITWADTDRGRGPTGMAIRSGQSCCIEDFATDPRVAPWKESALQHGYRSSIALPLKEEHGNAFGSLTIHSAQPNAFAPEEIRLLEELAGDLAFGITTLRVRAERQRAEEALRINDARYRTAEAVGHVGNWEYDVRTTRFWGSDEAKRIFGFDPGQADLATDQVENCIPERQRVHQALVDLVEAGKPYNLEFEIRPRGSTEARIISSVAQLLRDEQGDPLKVRGSIRDITESKHAEHSIALLNFALNNIREAALLIDETARFHYVNDEACRILGYTRAELLGMGVPDIDPEFPAGRWSDHWRDLQAQRSLSFESRHRTRDDRIFPVEINANYFEYGGRAYNLALVRDITERKRAEEALRQSEAYLAEAQRLSHTGSWAFDMASNNYVYLSEECYRILELDAQEDLPRGAISRHIHPEDWDRVNSDFEKLLREKVDVSSEFRIVLPSGTAKHVLAIRHPVLNEAGDVVRLVGSMIDITERKRAEEALRLSNAYNRSLIEASVDPLVTIGPDGKITDVNAATEAATGCSRGELIGTDFCDYFTEPAQARAGYEQVFREGTVRHYPLELRHQSGRVVSVLYNASVYRDETGRVIGVFAAARDITERKRAEEALRESHTRFRTFVDHAADALFMLDFEQGTIIDVNRCACESLGYTRQELIGMTPLVFDVNLDGATLEALGDRAGAGETVLFDRHWHRRKDGSLFPVEVNTSVFRHGGRRFLLKVARDISDRLQAEEQSERLRQLEADLAHINRVSMMGELTASIAHEVNQPLSGVVSNAGACLRWLARDVPDLEEAREAVSRIMRDGKRAAEVIARIRALTKRAAVPIEKLDFNETVREVLALVGDQAKSKSVIIRTQFADDLLPVRGDRVQLQQLMLNLTMNAIEAMSSVERRERELLITTRNVDADQVQVSVRDSGIGLEPSAVEKIFDAFYTTKPGGMGMGLSVCRSILRTHGGRLWATPNDGPGATFQFTLPKYQEEGSYAGV